MKKFMKKLVVPLVTICVMFLIILIYQFTEVIVYDFLDFHLYVGWQEVEIENIGEFKVPGHWKKETKDGLIYFCDPNIKVSDNSELLEDNIVFFQSKSSPFMLDGEPIVYSSDNVEKNILSDCFQGVLFVDGGINSLGTVYGSAVISVDNTTYLERYISKSYGDTQDLLFYSWQDRIDEETFEKIADSFK